MFTKFMQHKIFEPVLLFGAAALLFYVGAQIEAFELLTEFMESHEDWQLDEIFLAVVLLGSAGYIYAFRRQIEKQKEIQKRLSVESDLDWLSKHDHLTKLPNRHYLAEFVKRIGADVAERQDIEFGVIALDLDGFKKANDLMGHAAGDALLQEVARRIQSQAAVKLVFRLGGDEFLAITDLKKSPDTKEVARDLQTALLEPYVIDEAVSRIGVSIGISEFPADAASLQEVIHCSDLAMYYAKRSGGNDIVEFEPSMVELHHQRTQLEQDLIQAIADNQIKPHYQPLVDLTKEEIRGFEVLARWTHPLQGNIPPDMFIKVAEEIGVITELSDSIFRQACQDALDWPQHMILSFNLSPLQLSDQLISQRLIDILAETGFPPSRLVVEITESALVHDFDAASLALGKLREAGIQVALDDFGTGYSNLSQLSKLQFDSIKIDRSLISDFTRDEKQIGIVRTILALSEGLGMYATAEGIEDEDQLATLRELGCECGQGFFLGRPIGAEATHELLKTIEQVGSKKAIATLT